MKKIKLVIVAASLLSAAIFTGCQTPTASVGSVSTGTNTVPTVTPPGLVVNTNDLSLVAEAATVGVLAKYPQDRVYFADAQTALQELASNGTANPAAIQAALQGSSVSSNPEIVVLIQLVTRGVSQFANANGTGSNATTAADEAIISGINSGLTLVPASAPAAK